MNAGQPLAEVFGFLTTDQSDSAKRYRSHRLCPFNNKVPNCTKDKAKDPLGVCSVYYDKHPVITCPIRFREDWRITDDAASFFFRDGMNWSSLTEVRLYDFQGKSAGNIDVVLVAYDDKGKVVDFGSLEVQAVYISGNVREPFAYFMKDPEKRGTMDWTKEPNYPRPDFLSSSRKRLAPQLLFKGGILHNWKKKMAVSLDKSFFSTLPKLKRVPKSKADIAWFVYDLSPSYEHRMELTKQDVIYSEWPDFLDRPASRAAGDYDQFLKQLDAMLDEVVV